MGPVIRRLAPSQGSNGAGAHAAQGAEIHWVGAGRIAPEVVAGVPSIHMVWNGGYPLCVDGRSLRLEDEVFLVLNAGHVLTTRGRRDASACLLSVYFAPELLTRAFDDLAPASASNWSVLAAAARCACSSICATATAPSPRSCATSRTTSVQGSTIRRGTRSR